MNKDKKVGVALTWGHKSVLTALPDETKLLWMMFTNRDGGGKHVSTMAAYQVPADVLICSSNKTSSDAASDVKS